MEDKFVLNPDAPEDDPSPLKLRRDRGAQKTYKRRAPHAAEIEQLTAFVRYLFPSYARGKEKRPADKCRRGATLYFWGEV